MTCIIINSFFLIQFLIRPYLCEYIVLKDLNNNLTQTEWLDSVSNSKLNLCINSAKLKTIGWETNSNFINMKRTYVLPKTSLLYIYFEYQISGIWTDYELQVYANNILSFSEKISLNDISRTCDKQFQFLSYVYFVYNQVLDQLILEIKVNQNNIGLYVQNIILSQRLQAGRNEIKNFNDQILQCRSGTGLKFIQYYCQCDAPTVFKENSCQADCGQNYIYDPNTNNCYLKNNCDACNSNVQTVNCNSGYYKLNDVDVQFQDCNPSCPSNYYQNTITQTCQLMTEYLKITQNNGYPVNHYLFYNGDSDFLHFFQSNDFYTQVISTPTKIKERGFTYLNNKFVVGSYTTFQLQELYIYQIVLNSQYKLRVRAIAYFVDFYPSKIQFYVNGILQPTGTITASTTNLQEATQDYYIKYDVEWVRTEIYPVRQNIFKFIVEQPLQDGDYKGYFYVDDIHVFQFECQTGCNACFTYQYCNPCFNPANKNMDDCTCLSGYVMKNDICISCPTYCTTCDVADICVACKATSLRTNSPACDTCPSNYYIKANTENCQPCITGCKVCSNDTICTQCQSGYFRNSSNICVTQCPDGQLNDSSNINDPKCSICDNNCLTCQNLATTCTGCKGLATLISGHCYFCNDGQYLSGTTCVSCIQNCQICQNVTCGSCLESFFYKSQTNECLSLCDDGYFGNTTTRTCDACNSSCLTCIGGTNLDCLSCSAGKVLNKINVLSGECSLNCFLGYYKQNNQCIKCWKGCYSCFDNTSECLICAAKYYRLKSDNQCYELCPDGYYNNNQGNQCSQCDVNCKTCNGFSEINCLSCNAPLAYYQNQCLTDCLDGYGNQNNVCVQCSANCKSCFGTQPNQCLSCDIGFYYLNNQCYSKCPTSFVGIRPQYVCKCIYDNCVTCTATQYFLNNSCYVTCPPGSYGYNGLCIQCHLTCKTCFGEGVDECMSCNTGLILFEKKCIPNCFGNLYPDIGVNECKYCDSSCMACTGPDANNCSACPDGKLLSLNGRCQDNCSDGEYAVLSEKKCYTCHSSCVTCFGSSYKNCLTCPSGQFVYLFECVASCPDGFIISSNGVNCDPNTAIVITQCAYQCQTCELTARFCKKCAANRSSNAPNCDCESGYFDDGVSSSCPPCANKCQTCTGVATHCLKCKGDRLLPNCECPQYYYDDGESVNCTKCQDNCETCDSNGCISCLADRLNPPFCECPDGYFEAFEYYCQECAKKCTKCSDSALLCQTCSGIRESPPICQCPSGYFENAEEECQQCDVTCKDCNISGCLSCAANRVGPNNGECKCDKHGISRYSISQVYCTDCFVGVPYFGLNEDFTGFYFEFGGLVQILQTETEDLCQRFFSALTLAKLGSDPVCDEDLNVIFGKNPTIQVGDTIQLQNVFVLVGCENAFTTILPLPLAIPQTIDLSTHLPSVKFQEISPFNLCSENKIEFYEEMYNGNQKLKIIKWFQQLPQVQKPEIVTIFQKATDDQSNSAVIPAQIFDAGQFYKISVTVESFSKLQNTISFQFTAIQQSKIQFISTQNLNQFYRSQKITIPFQIKYYKCNDQNPTEKLLFYEIKLKNQNLLLINETLKHQIQDGFTYDVPITFQPYFFGFQNPYIISLHAKLSSDENIDITNDIFNIFIVPQDLILTIQGGNRMIGYTEALYLNGTIQDPDLTEEEAIEVDYKCYWSCQDIINGTACQNQANQTIQFDNSCNQVIPRKSFAPYQVFNFEMFVEKQSILYSTRVSIQMIEIDLPALIVEGPNQNQTYNYYDEFVYKLVYPGINPDILMYAGAVIYDQVVQATFQFYYLEFKFKIQNYFTNFNSEKGNIGKLRLSVYDPRFIMPSLNTQMITFNIPPNSCMLDFNYDEGVIEFIEILTINILNCKDENSPLIYSIMLFPNNSIYQNDLEQSNFYHYLLIAPTQENSHFQFSLPFLNKQNSLLVFNIQDSQEGIFNITKSISIKQYQNITEQDFRTYQQKLISLDDILIGYNLITERLNSITDLWEYKEELLQELIQLDQNQSFLSNQTETLYHCVSNLLSQNVSLIQKNESLILQQLNYRIELAKEKLIYFTDLQKNNLLTSTQNVVKSNYVKQYYTFTNILSSYINYRVGQNVSATEIQDQLSAMVNYLQDISIPNEPMYKVQSNSVNMNFGFLTTKMAGEIAGATVKDDTPEGLRLLETQADSNSQQNNSSTSFFKFSQTRFVDNPFYTSDKFPKNSSGYQAVDPKMINVNSSTISKNLSSAMKFKFPVPKTLPTNTSTKCIAQVDSGDWNADICKSVKKNGETVCECNSVNPTSIMESLDYLMDKAAEVFSLDTLLAFASFPFYKTIVFYFYLLMTGGYAYIVYWGMKVDHVMFEKIAIEKEIQEAEQKLKEEQEKLKKENDDKMGEENKEMKEEQEKTEKTEKQEENRYTEQNDIRNTEHNEEDLMIKKDYSDLNSQSKTIFSKNRLKPRQPRRNSALQQVQVHITNQQIRPSSQSQLFLENKNSSIISSQNPQNNIEVQQKDELQTSQPEEQNNGGKVTNTTIAKIKAYIEYLKFFHQILSIIYKDDDTQPRGLRASIIYTSVMGSLAVIFVFGQIDNITLTLALALITAPLNKIYQLLLEKMLSSLKKHVRILGVAIMIFSTLGISYTMLAGLVLSGSVEAANQWSFIFIGTFSVDNIFYNPVQLIFQYGIHVGLLNMPAVKKILDKLLDKNAKAFIAKILRRRR